MLLKKRTWVVPTDLFLEKGNIKCILILEIPPPQKKIFIEGRTIFFSGREEALLPLFFG